MIGGVPPYAEATRKAPAQTELRPTCAGVPAPTYVLCIGVTRRAWRSGKAPVRAEAHPT
jgi:hypothetical protein